MRLQQQHWAPLFDWLSKTYGVELEEAEGFSPSRQSQQTIDKLTAVVSAMDQWELAGALLIGANVVANQYKAFERAVYSTKSFVIALALCKGRLTANEAADASHVEVRSQIERYGEVEDSESCADLCGLRGVRC